MSEFSLPDCMISGCPNYDRLNEQVRVLRSALRQLRNEVSGMLSMEEDEMRRLVGNTNVNVLILVRDHADETLAATEPRHEG